MLRLNKLSLCNFGPFRNVQQIDFPREPGVVIVYGENGRGKTSLLNAIRYALFGKVLGRGSVSLPISKLGNWDSASEGDYKFSVELEFSHNSIYYVLTRLCKLAPGVLIPTGDGDFVQEVFLKRDGEVLGPEEARVELTRVMPEQVSRFFLFDGELLQEYEQLLIEESEAGQKIKDSIERILGVPVLTSAKRTLDILLKEARDAESKAAQRDKTTKVLGENLEFQTTRKKNQTDELERARLEITKFREEKGRVDEQRRKFERVAKLIAEEEEIERRIDELGQAIADGKLCLKGAAKNAWRAVLELQVHAARRDTDSKISALQAKGSRAAHNMLKIALEKGECPVCIASLDDARTEFLVKHLNAHDAGKAEAEELELQQLYAVSGPLRDFSHAGCKEILAVLTGQLDDVKIEMARKQHRLEEVKENIKGHDIKEVRDLTIQSELLVRDLALLENKVDTLNKDLSDIEGNIRRIEETLDRDAGAKLLRERSRRDLLTELLKLFDEAVHSYRERLRKRVENDATDLFRKFSSDSDYSKLEINENYGLSIVHRDGNKIAVRSAGFEHIVALSLMGALQKNAPLSGPIIMDSPFGRLDGMHTRNVTKALPDMAEQIMLLVYEEELEPKLAHEELAGRLRSEYKMSRIGSRHTELRKNVGK